MHCDGFTTPPTLKSIGEALLRFEIIDTSDWEAATRDGTDDVPEVLRRLHAMAASWSRCFDSTYTALTEYQITLIQAGQPCKLRLDHYVLLDQLGAGASGQVFKVRNLKLPRIEAIKLFRSDSPYPSADARFAREIRLLAQMQHPSFTTIHYAGCTDAMSFYAMDFIDGYTLRELVSDSFSAHRPLPIATAVKWIGEIASALSVAHRRGIIHRDLKPDNVMVTRHDRAIILDWSLAKIGTCTSPSLDSERLTAEATAIGSPEVMPAEQWADGHCATPQADIYSLGCTFFFALIGRMPFLAERASALMHRHAYDEPPVPSNLRLEVPENIDRIVLKMLAKQPADRYASVEQLRADLDNVA